jgi:hypothetical protein
LITLLFIAFIFWSTLMNTKIWSFAVLLCGVASTAFTAPILSVTPGGIQGGNWVWDVSVTPDLLLAPSGTPLAVELGFRMIGDPLISATNINPSEWDTPIPGKKIFGWEPDDIDSSTSSGLRVNTSTSEVFVAYGSIDFTTPGAKPLLKIIAQGPGSGGPASSTIQYLGARPVAGTNGRIAQIVGATGVNFDLYSGLVTQTPEPASAFLLVLGSVVLVLRRNR